MAGRALATGGRTSLLVRGRSIRGTDADMGCVVDETIWDGGSCVVTLAVSRGMVVPGLTIVPPSRAVWSMRS